VSRSRDLLRSSFENTPLTMPATSSPERVVKHLEESRFELDEKARCSREHPPYGAPRCAPARHRALGRLPRRESGPPHRSQPPEGSPRVDHPGHPDACSRFRPCRPPLPAINGARGRTAGYVHFLNGIARGRPHVGRASMCRACTVQAARGTVAHDPGAAPGPRQPQPRKPRLRRPKPTGPAGGVVAIVRGILRRSRHWLSMGS
jgi:hypothetical protein